MATAPGAPDVRTASAAPPPPVVSGRSGDSDGTGCARASAASALWSNALSSFLNNDFTRLIPLPTLPEIPPDKKLRASPFRKLPIPDPILPPSPPIPVSYTHLTLPTKA